MRAAIEESELVTKKDLQIELAPIKADLNLLRDDGRSYCSRYR